MRKRTVITLLFSSALVALTLPNIAWAAAEETSAVEPPKIQVKLIDGKFYVTNPAPNPPVTLPEPIEQVASQTLDGGMPARIQSMVQRISKTHGVDPQLVAAVMKVESNYDPGARSSKGALGLMQLIPATGARFGVREFFDPAQNIEGGVKYLRFLSDKFGSAKIDLILAAYNAGENLVERLGKVPPIQETRDYVHKILAIYTPSSKPALALVAASEAAKPVAETAVPAPEPQPAPARIYRTVDERGVAHYSSIGPPN